MKAFLFVINLMFLLFTNCPAVSADEAVKETTTSAAVKPVEKGPKVLCLIISSDNMQAYLDLQKIWKSYMHSDPAHFEVYFIQGDPELPTAHAIKGDHLFVKTAESYAPGIVNKTVLSIEALMSRMDEFDYVLRTNLSSFYVFPRLLNFVKTLPKERCYCGIQMHTPASWHPNFGLINFVSGAGILLSKDLAKMMVNEKEEIFKYSSELPDDVLIGYFYQKRGILSMPAERVDFPTREAWLANKHRISDKSFHFRAKNNYNMRSAEENFADEIVIDKELLKMFYPNAKEVL